MYQKVSTDMNFAQREEEVIKFWRDEDVFKKTVKLREGAPAFTFFVNHTDLINDSYRRYIENRMRATFDFKGTPIRLRFRKKDQKEMGKEDK